MLREFRNFIMRGNVIDLAIGFVMGLAFGKIVTSFVTDIIMPPIGLLLGGVTFADLFINLSGTPYATLKQAQAAGAATINYGVFLNAVIEFLIIAFVIFLIVRQVNRARQKSPVVKECPYCKSVIPIAATRCPACTSQLAAEPS
ncbi:MAG TPA: large conductance mechanosensitive channel protein MscL [bacterium]|jgi:large conductance mechanosensitive channel